MGDRDTRIVVLGAGMIGSAVVMDLRRDGWPVTVADTRPAALEQLAARYGAATVTMDLGDPRAVARIAEAHELVVGALPSVLGFRAVEAVIAAGRNMVDISFMPEDALDLGDAARARGVTAVVDCGVAPGVSNLMVGHAVAAASTSATTSRSTWAACPASAAGPSSTRRASRPTTSSRSTSGPPRLVEHGQVVVREALSEPELMDFPGVGTLEAFNTDGLRSIVHDDQGALHEGEDAALPRAHRAHARLPRDRPLLEGADRGGGPDGCGRST